MEGRKGKRMGEEGKEEYMNREVKYWSSNAARF